MKTFAASLTVAALLLVTANAQARQYTTLASSLTIRGQYFDATVEGLRRYLETIRSNDPQLYAHLDPELSKLESRRNTALAVLLAGVGLGVVSTVYGFAGKKSCASPSVTDPSFAADADAWGRCNDDNMRTTATFTAVGLGAALAGLAISAALFPRRSDIFGIVNEHNRLSHEPLRWQLGYEPIHRTALAGASLSF